MAKGYWSWGGPKAKFCCEVCGHVCKAPWEGSPVCPGCRIPMVCMGDKWRPRPVKWWRMNVRDARDVAEHLKKSRDAFKSG